MTTLREYRVNLGWSLNELAKASGISQQIARRAEDGDPIQARTAKAIAIALSRALGRNIEPLDIEGLSIL
jgi:transcriptional regulator with XRE-family HTH domain